MSVTAAGGSSFASQYMLDNGAGRIPPRAAGLPPPQGMNPAVSCERITMTPLIDQHDFTAWVVLGALSTSSFLEVLSTHTKEQEPWVYGVKVESCLVIKEFLQKGALDMRQLSALFARCIDMMNRSIQSKYFREVAAEIALQKHISRDTMRLLMEEPMYVKPPGYTPCIAEYMSNFVHRFDVTGKEFWNIDLPYKFKGTLEEYARGHHRSVPMVKTLVFVRAESIGALEGSFFPSPVVKIKGSCYQLKGILVENNYEGQRALAYETYLFQPDGSIFKYDTHRIGTGLPELFKIEETLEDIIRFERSDFSKEHSSAQSPVIANLATVIKRMSVNSKLYLYERMSQKG